MRIPKPTKGRVQRDDQGRAANRGFVNDQEAALDFYTNKLGLEKIRDEPYGEGTRWITVSPAGSRIMIALEKAERDYEKALVGRSEGRLVLVLSTDDILATYERLLEEAHAPLPKPVRYPWGGIGVRFLDQDGSPIFLQQESGER
jgi:catechol 2,3-dioxygenase-like lactoylglutathione lyase family enzyme